MSRPIFTLLSFALLGCPRPAPPGDQSMGSWSVIAEPDEVMAGCQLTEVVHTDGGVDTLAFDMTLTRDTSSNAAWMTLAGISREGTFDGQYFSNVAEASRVFTACAKCQMRVIERFDVAVLSRSQADALGGCPRNVLDFGVVPAANDAGITAPMQTPQGFDAVRLCGFISNEVVADGLEDGGACDAKCSGCFVTFLARGERR